MIDRRVDANGRVIFCAKDAVELLLRGYDISTLLIAPDVDIRRYNQTCESRDRSAYQIADIPSDEESLIPRINTWFMSDRYRDLAVRQELLARCERTEEMDRVNVEMDMFEARGLVPVLRLMFYLVDQFRETGVVWGVGRGSSVASYCLFLIGVHRIDSLFYNLSIKEFLK